ncbi:MAG: ATP-binding protein, partial [Actinomycetes bacterium]
PTAVLSTGAVLYLVAFLLASTGDLGLRTAQSGRRGLTWVASIMAIVGLTVVGFFVHNVIGDGAWFAGVLALALTGVGVLTLVAVRSESRRRAVETARTEIVAQREAERRGLRADLHDGLGPLLAALGLVLDDAGTAQPLTQARTLLAEAIAEVRRISRDLGPAALDDLGLVGALQKQAAGLTTTSGPRFLIRTDPAPLPALPAAVEVAVFRIVSEAMTNVVRHAEASECLVRIEISGDEPLRRYIRLEVLDDGCGMSERGSGLGLPSMAFRVEELGGQLDIGRRAPQGTVVTATLPVPA